MEIVSKLNEGFQRRKRALNGWISCLFAEYIRGYDIEGNEKLWIVTSGKVNSLALVDFNNDGKNEVNTTPNNE